MFSRQVSVVAVVSLLATGLVAGVVQAAEGDLDPGFGTAGFTRTIIGPSQNDYDQAAEAVALTPNNDIVVAGYNNILNSDFLVALYDSDGRLKDSIDIGVGGYYTVDFGNGYDSAYGVAVQSDGKIVAVGSATIGGVERFGIARFDEDLNPDETFDGEVSGNGKVTTAVGSTRSYATAVAIQSDGKIVAVGAADGDVAVVRYMPDGTLDTSFSGDGIVRTNLGGADSGNAVAIEPDGDIVVVGEGNNDFAVLRYLPNGNPDTSFGDDGVVTTNIGTLGPTIDEGTSVVLQPDGKILVAGIYGTNTAIVRYRSDGVVDTTFDGNFNTNGIVTPFFSAGVEALGAIALQSDGKFILGGWAESGTGSEPENFVVARFNTDGTRDFGFGGGLRSADFNGARDVSRAMLLQPDGAIVQVGGVKHPQFTKQDIGLVRYIGDDTPPTVVVSRTGSGALGIGQSETISITLSELSTDFVASDIAVTNGSLVLTGSGTSYSAVVTPVDKSVGTMTVSIPAGVFTDKASNANTSEVSVSIDFDTLRSQGAASGATGSETAGSTTNAATGGSVNGLITYKTGNKKITFSFPTIPNASRYLLTNSAGRTVCDTAATSCIVRNLGNGKASTYSFGFQDTSGAVQTGIDSVRAMAGFKLGASVAKVRKKVTLTKFVSTPSKGGKTWRVTKGQCRISGRKLVMPTKAGRCTLKLSVAKKATYPAMSTSVRITVTR